MPSALTIDRYWQVLLAGYVVDCVSAYNTLADCMADLVGTPTTVVACLHDLGACIQHCLSAPGRMSALISKLLCTCTECSLALVAGLNASP